MKPVEQIAGECMQACVASILEVDQNDIKSYASHVATREDGEIYTWLHDALDEHGYTYKEVSAKEAGEDMSRVQGYTMAIGYAAHTMIHACVALNGEVVHDPHESKAGLLKIRWYIVLEKKDPLAQVVKPKAAVSQSKVPE